MIEKQDTPRIGRDTHPTRLIIVLIALALTLTGSPFAVPVGFTVVLIAGLAGDRSAFRRLGKPRFWVFSVMIVLAAGLLLGREPRPVFGVPVSMEGLQAGLIMNLRAFTLVLGFVLVSRSLTQDQFLSLTGRVGLPYYVPAFNQALETLPQMKNAWSASKTSGRMFGFNALVDFLIFAKRLAQNPVSGGLKIYAVTGRRFSGKTTLLKRLHQQAVKKGIKAGGIIQLRFSDEVNNVEGYKVVSLNTGETMVIAEKQVGESFRFHDEAFRAAVFWLEKDAEICDLILVDEMGMLEAKGAGYAPAVLSLLEKYPGKVWVMALRKDKLLQLCDVFVINHNSVLDLDKRDRDVDPFVNIILLRL